MNNFKHSELNSRFKIRAVCRAVFFLLILTNAVSALDWNDKEWVDANCPPNIFGTWVFDDMNIGNEKVLNIRNNKISLIINHILEEEYYFDKKNMVMNEKFMEVNLQSVLSNGEKSAYLKIRPHLVSLENDSKNTNTTAQNCLIKVFEFESKNDAKFDKYLNWEIYKLKSR